MHSPSLPRYAVTGVAGFIGSRLLEVLAALHPAVELLAGVAVIFASPPSRSACLRILGAFKEMEKAQSISFYER